MSAISLKSHNTLRLDSSCLRLFAPLDTDELVSFYRKLDNPIILGNGSNVILASKIMNDVIVTGGLDAINIDSPTVYAQGGVKTISLSQKALNEELSGFEFLIGIPGSLGGAVLMNASAHKQSISDFLVFCDAYDKEKDEIVRIEKKDCGFSYRSSVFKKNDKYIILGACFELKKSEKGLMLEMMNENIAFRKEKQPKLSLPNAGSIFKNPENDSAGRLLDECGMKGETVGGAKVWEGHANFIVNTGSANSTDISQLMFKMYNSVREKFGIELEPEVLFVGEKNDIEREIWDIMLRNK